MFPFFVLFLAMIFLVLKFSGILDEFTERMQRFWGRGEKGIRELIEPFIQVEDVENRLEVFRDYLEQSPEDDESPPSSNE
jgi:hypothetical protein